MKISEINIGDLDLMGTSDVSSYMGITPTSVLFYTKKYNIPHSPTSAGNIYMKKDIDAFQLSRADRLKYRRNNHPEKG